MYINPNKMANRLIVADEMLATAQAIPQNTNADGDEGYKEIAGDLGALEVIFSAKTAVALTTSNSTFTGKLIDSADGSTGAADIPGGSVTVTPGTGAAGWAAGAVIGRIIVPTQAKRYVKCNIATNSSGATGTVDASVHYIPR